MDFTIGQPEPPVLISPVGAITSINPTYSWNESQGATRYKLLVYSASQGRIIYTENHHHTAVCSGDVCSITPSIVLSAGDYNFKVKGYNSMGWGATSPWSKFEILP
jgi:hypothetical protein